MWSSLRLRNFWGVILGLWVLPQECHKSLMVTILMALEGRGKEWAL